jgi:hypothetical protein
MRTTWIATFVVWGCLAASGEAESQSAQEKHPAANVTLRGRMSEKFTLQKVGGRGATL